jgi:putative ABC transport system permease protein
MRDWRDVREEVAQHAADVRRQALRDGLGAAEADRLAQAEMARLDMLVAQLPRRHWWSGTVLDVGHGWRLLRRQRGHSVLVVATLAISIGGCTAVYSLFNALLLRPLPFPDSHRLVLLWETDADDPRTMFVVAAPNYADWAASTRSFETLGIWSEMTFNVASASAPEQVDGLRASSSLFRVLGIPAQLGRVFTSEEDASGAFVAVISDALWRSQFAGRHDVIGQSLRLNGTPHEIVGVMPAGFEFPYRGAGVWVPLALTPQDQERGAHSFWVAGRLKDSVTFEQAQGEIERLGAELRQRHVENRGEGATVMLMSDYGVRQTRRTLQVLAGAVGLVLAIACVNVASLQLALGLGRRREFATRLSLGATYARLLRQVGIEALLIAGVAGGAGIAVAWVATRIMDLALPPGFLRVMFRGDVAVVLDSGAVGVAVAVSSIAALAFAFAPLIGLPRTSASAMREGGRGATRAAATARRVLVTIEVALAVVILAGAGLMTKSLAALLQVDPGIASDNVLTMRVSLPQRDTYGRPERAAFCQNLAREVNAVSGVIRASAVSHLPLTGANAGRALTIDGRPQAAANEGPSASYRLACPGYFETLGIPLLAGRDFTHDDQTGQTDVTIINRAFADRYWPNGGALGERIKLGGFDSPNPWLTIVGIAENVRHFGLDSAPPREIYRPYAQAVWPVMTVVAKTVADPATWERPLRAALARVEPDLPAASALTMNDVVRRSVGWREAPMRLLAGFALIGLLLAAFGVYGVLAYYVSQRAREFGVRAALGASKSALCALVLRQSAAPLITGIVVGLFGSIGAGRLLSGLLFDVVPSDPVVLSSVVGILLAVSFVSSWWPARRAALVDPSTVLRDE